MQNNSMSNSTPAARSTNNAYVSSAYPSGVGQARPKSIPPVDMSKVPFSSVGLSHESAERIWQELKAAIEKINEGNHLNLRYEELYRQAYTLVLHKHGDKLYRGVEQTVNGEARFFYCQSDLR